MFGLLTFSRFYAPEEENTKMCRLPGFVTLRTSVTWGVVGVTMVRGLLSDMNTYEYPKNGFMTMLLLTNNLVQLPTSVS